MAKKRKLLKLFILSPIILFLAVCCYFGIIFWIFRPEPGKLIPAALFVSYDLGQDMYAAMKYYCLPHSPSKDWIECRKTKEIRRYLKKEKVQKIAFWSVGAYDGNSPDSWGWEIAEPEKIKQTLQLISTARKAVNISIVWLGRMSVITDKHKLIVPVEIGDDAVYGLDWTSGELRKQLWKWGLGHKVYQYDLPPKEKTIAMLFYPPKFSPPLVFFGDKKLAEELLFNPPVKDPNGIKGLAGLYKTALLRTFGFEFKKEAGKLTPASNELKPKKLYEGREWLEKIMDAYEIALKKAEEREKYFPMELDNPVGRIVFMTRDGNYWKEIGIDQNNVYDDYIISEQLKTYFDELGLTDDLSAGRSQVD